MEIKLQSRDESGQEEHLENERGKRVQLGVKERGNGD